MEQKDDVIDLQANGTEHSVSTQNGPLPETHRKQFLAHCDNPVFLLNDETIESVPPPLSYVDFLPQLLLKAEKKEEAPAYARFGTLIDQANHWLQANQDFMVWKCETVFFKLRSDENVMHDEAYYMESAYGINKYLMGLRIWVVPKPCTDMPVAQIGYTTALPGRKDLVNQGEYESKIVVTQKTKMTEMVDNLNKQFTKNHLPGVILNIETVTYRCSCDTAEQAMVDPDETCWLEDGNKKRVFVYGLRVFFIHGKEEYATIGFHDEVPEVTSPSGATFIKFGPFKTAVTRTGSWLSQQKNIRVVNLQSINYKCFLSGKGEVQIEKDFCGAEELPYAETRYVKILRTFYVSSKSDELPYSSLNLTTRLFVPTRIVGRQFESFPKTMLRITKWMNHTRVPPFGVETVQYLIFIDGDGTPLLEEKVDTCVHRTNGRYNLSTVRMYFPSGFTEPPPDLIPDVATSYASSWGCSIS